MVYEAVLTGDMYVFFDFTFDKRENEVVVDVKIRPDWFQPLEDHTNKLV